MQLEEATKKGLDWIAKVFIVFCIALVLYSIGAIASAETPKGSYKAAVDGWQLTHDKLLNTLRSSECNGVDLKLIANANDEFTLTPDEVKRLSEKKLTCAGF